VNVITGSSNSKSSLVLNVAPLPQALRPSRQALADVLPVVIAVTECLSVLLKFFRIDDLNSSTSQSSMRGRSDDDQEAREALVSNRLSS
jgi:hypothetical protein